MVQGSRLCTSTAGDKGSIPGRGTKIPNAAQHGQKKNRNNSLKTRVIIQIIVDQRPSKSSSNRMREY